MADTPTAAFSILLRVRFANEPGALGRLAAAVGSVGGNIVAIGGFEARRSFLEEDVVVDCTSEAHQQEVLEAASDLEGVEVMSWEDRTFALHDGGKVEVTSRIAVRDRDDLSMAYTPGVARVCKAIEAEPSKAHELTIRKNTVAIVSDGTAVLGLGDIGPLGAMPVMEGKALLFKEFAGIDGFPMCIDTSSADEIVETVQRVAPTFGGINLEDIAAPVCFEVEERLKELLDIPVFHDDQHGTAVVVLAALENALKIVDKKMIDLRVVIAGVGAAGVAISKILIEAGVPWIVGCDRQGAIYEGRGRAQRGQGVVRRAHQPRQGHGQPHRLHARRRPLHRGQRARTHHCRRRGRDGPRPDRVRHGQPRPRDPARGDPPRGSRVIATGRSDFPNQINNVLCFPGIFRGALDAGATTITEGMKVAAAGAIAACVSPAELAPDFVIPSVFDRNVAPMVAAAAAEAAVRDGVVRG